MATVSINLLINEGIIGKSAEAVFRTEIEQYNEELKLAITEDSLNNLGFRDNKFNVRRSNYNDENSFTDAMKTKIPSFDKKYADKLEIKEDQLNYIGEDEQERTWLAQVISVAGMLKISYVYENGSQAAPTYQKVIIDGSYEVESPTISGYEPDHYIVAGEIDGDTNIIVTYISSSQGLNYIGLDSSGNETNIEEDVVAYTVSGIGTFTGDNLVIPRIYNNKSVIKVKTRALAANNTIKTLIIPETIKIIEYEAIRSCTKLEYIYLNAETVKNSSFKTTTNLKKVDIGKNVKELENSPFEACTKLTDLTIYSEQAEINVYKFSGCTSLKEIKTNKTNSKYKVEEGVLYSKDGKKIYMYPQAKEGEFIIPSSVEEIGQYAFFKNLNLTRIDIPDTVNIVENNAFNACNNIEYLKLNANTVKGYYAFRDMANLKKIDIGTNLISIGSYTFQGSTNIEETNYLGTKEQWDSINKSFGWAQSSSITQITCRNGTIEL